MPLNPTKPTFTFFKMLGCGHCTHFDQDIWSKLIKDTEVRTKVNLDRVEFGRDRDGTIYSLEEEYPDFNIEYAPYLWLSAPYNEKTKYHLNPTTMHNPSLNRRQRGFQFNYTQDTTFQGLKNWILRNNQF